MKCIFPPLKGILAACLLALCLSPSFSSPLAAREKSIQELKDRNEWSEERRLKRLERLEKKHKARGGTTLKKKDKPPQTIISMAFISRQVIAPPALSNLDPILTDEGIHGMEIGVEDNNTTGKFLNQKYIISQVTVPTGQSITQAFKKLVGEGISYFVADLPAADLLQLADLPQAAQTLIFSLRAPDDSLRNEDCRANILHVGLSRAMKTDALAQFLVKKRWEEWFLVVGPRQGDRLFAAAVRKSAKKFGAKVVEEKTWNFTHDIRRTARKEVPVFTNEGDYDVLFVADEPGEFGEYLIYNTWDPRLVVGTQGLVPTSWHRTHEQWGSAQMQNRFRRTAGRWMTPVDYAAWIAARSIGEAVTRATSPDFDKVKDYILSPEFSLAAYKGIKVNYRPWNGQLRQRVLLAAPRALISVSPQEGYLHPVSETDTLGVDAPETKCKLAKTR